MKVKKSLGIKKPATEETLQSIDDTLKRIVKILLDQTPQTTVPIVFPDRGIEDLVDGHLECMEISVLSEICMPVVKYLKKNSDPYTEVHISVDGIKVTSVKCGIPLNK